MSTTLNKLEYTDETKGMIKTALNTKFGAGITDQDTFRSYVDKIGNIYNNWPKVTGEGTEVTLEGTKVGKIGIDIQGNSTQETTTGKNEIYLPDVAETTLNGLTFSVKDNVITINGTATALTQIVETTIFNIPEGNNSFNIIPISGTWTAGTFGLRGFVGSSTNQKFYTQISYNITNLKANHNYTENELLSTRINLYSTSTGVFNNYKFMVMIVNGDTVDKEFEEYSGGLPSPNPSYPQPIYSAGNEAVGLPIEYTQLDYIESSETQYIDTGFKPNQDTAVELDYNYVDDGVLRHDWSAFGVNDLFNFTASNISPLRVKYNGVIFNSTHSTLNRFKVKLDKNKVYVDGILENTFTSATFSCTQNALLFARRNNANGALQERSKMKLYNCKIWDNGTLIRNFIPCYRNSDKEAGLYDIVNNVFYTNQGTGSFIKGNVVGITEKIVNKNLWNKNNIIIVWGKGYNSSGEWVSYSGADWGGNNYKEIPLNENTAYVLSGKLVSSGYTSRFHFFDINGKFISAENKVNTGGVDVYTFTTPAKARYLSIQAYKPYYNTDTIQLEQGLTATEYVAHQEQNFIIPCQQPMREIGKEDGSTAKDGFINENNNWLERHWVNRLILTGNESVTTMSTYCFKISNVQNGYSSNNALKGIKCLYFREKTQPSVYGGSQGIAILGGTTNALYFSFGTNSEINTSEKFKAKLKEYYDAGTPIYVDYLANEPTNLPCTEEQTQVLEAIVNSYDDQTNVYTEDGTPAYIEVSALKKGGN